MHNPESMPLLLRIVLVRTVRVLEKMPEDQAKDLKVMMGVAQGVVAACRNSFGLAKAMCDFGLSDDILTTVADYLHGPNNEFEGPRAAHSFLAAKMVRLLSNPEIAEYVAAQAGCTKFAVSSSA